MWLWLTGSFQPETSLFPDINRLPADSSDKPKLLMGTLENHSSPISFLPFAGRCKTALRSVNLEASLSSQASSTLGLRVRASMIGQDLPSNLYPGLLETLSEPDRLKTSEVAFGTW